MKILYIITQADGGGAQKYTLALARHFKGAIAAGQEAKQLFEDAKTTGLDVYPLKYLKRSIHPVFDCLALFEIISLIKKLKPDIVHLNSSKAGFLGSIAVGLYNLFSRLSLSPKISGRLKTGIRIIFTAHGFIFNEPFLPITKWFFLILEKFASLFRDYIICVSDADKESALKHKLIDPAKISVIHNGLAPINFLTRDEAKKALGLRSDQAILGSIANFYKTKGLDILVDAISLLDKQFLNQIHLVIVGEGKERIFIEKKILEYELGPKITLIGKLSDAEKYLKAFDIFLLPSRKEGFPFVLLEAMQAGLPIIASKVGGIPEALEDAGLQVRAEDPKALAEAITKLLNDANLAAQFAQRAEQRSQLFTQEKMLGETKKIYEKLLK